MFYSISVVESIGNLMKTSIRPERKGEAMKTVASIASVVNISVVIISVVIVAAGTSLLAADSHTVISVTGKAWHKTEGQGSTRRTFLRT